MKQGKNQEVIEAIGKAQQAILEAKYKVKELHQLLNRSRAYKLEIPVHSLFQNVQITNKQHLATIDYLLNESQSLINTMQ